MMTSLMASLVKLLYRVSFIGSQKCLSGDVSISNSAMSEFDGKPPGTYFPITKCGRR